MLCLQAYIPELDPAAWHRNRETCVRLAVQHLERLMRQHLEYLADADCRSAKAPSAQPKHVLKRAFWKVDPQRSGLVSLQQFLQVTDDGHGDDDAERVQCCLLSNDINIANH